MNIVETEVANCINLKAGKFEGYLVGVFLATGVLNKFENTCV